MEDRRQLLLDYDKEMAEFNAYMQRKETVEESQEASEVDMDTSPENIPIIVVYLNQQRGDEVVARVGLQTLLAMLTVEGNEEQVELAYERMVRHQVPQTLLHLLAEHTNQPEFQLITAKILGKLMVHPSLQKALSSERGRETPLSIRLVEGMGRIAHRQFSREDIVIECLRSISSMCSVSELCKDYLVSKPPLLLFLTKVSIETYRRNPDVLVASLEILASCATHSAEGLETSLYSAKGVSLSIKCMKKHKRHSLVLQRALEFLLLAGERDEQAKEAILTLRAIPQVIHAMKALVHEEFLQLRGLQLIQELSKTEDGWQQIEEERGAWQWLLQGDRAGNQLLHDQPGFFNNRGWCIGETPHLSNAQKLMLRGGRDEGEGGGRGGESKEQVWTSASLLEFIGASVRQLRVPSNTEVDTLFFDTVKNLGLLPFSGEGRDEWLRRVRTFEQEKNLSIASVVQTKQELLRTGKLKLMQEKGAEAAEETELFPIIEATMCVWNDEQRERRKLEKKRKEEAEKAWEEKQSGKGRES